MIRLTIVALGLLALGLSVASCKLPCVEPWWKKEHACHESGPVN
jgi:hypothetical protein